MTWYAVLFHRVKQMFVRPTCTYCTLACEPQYGKRCEVCDEADE